MTRKDWIGVDLDGTLARKGGLDDTVIGEPIPAMLARVKTWLNEGKRVKIFTARACEGDVAQIALIKAWCLKHVGQELEVTATKDYDMAVLWDDRCVQVVPNTGRPANGEGVK